MSNSLFSQDSETAVLSIILKNPESAFSLHGLKFFMFSSLPNQHIFSQVEEMVGSNLMPEPALIIESLRSSGKLQQCGGKEYIEFLYKSDFSKDNLLEFARIVMSSYKARALLSMTSNLRADDFTVDNVDSIVAKFNESINKLSESSTSSTVHIGAGINGVYDEIISRTNNPGIRGTSWGFRKIDLVSGGKNPGDIIYIGGRPGSGKSAFVCNTILSDGRNGVPSLLFSKEMNYTTLIERLAAIDSGVPLSNIRLGVLTQEQLDLISDSLKRLKTYPIYLDTNFMIDAYYMENVIRKFHSINGVQNVYVDYMQLIAERDENMTHALGKISRSFKNTANSLSVTIVALSQLSREVEHRDNKRPIMSDLRQSGNLEEDADIVVGLYRDEYYNKDTKFPGTMEFIILKQRNGPTGTITLNFEGANNRITGD